MSIMKVKGNLSEEMQWPLSAVAAMPFPTAVPKTACLTAIILAFSLKICSTPHLEGRCSYWHIPVAFPG